MEKEGAKTGGGFTDPERIVQSFGLKNGDHAADFGAGHGYFTLPLARAVGREGQVWAIDIRPEALDIIESRARREHLLNVVCVRADLDLPGGSGLREKFLDFVLIADILFQAERRDVLAREAWRCLRSGGRLAMIEWDSDAASGGGLGPPQDLRVKKEDARALAVQAGFEPEQEFPAGRDHYGLLFIKK